jgi:hypothetical protein
MLGYKSLVYSVTCHRPLGHLKDKNGSKAAAPLRSRPVCGRRPLRVAAARSRDRGIPPAMFDDEAGFIGLG